jgi:pilus assembly protein CpaB
MLIGAVLAILVGLLASRFVYKQFQQQGGTAIVKPSKTEPVVVAAVPLALGNRVLASQLRVIDWPAGSTPAGSFKRPEDCAGRALITAVVPNEAILEPKLAPREAGAGLPAVIPEGMRAVSVRVDDVVGVAGFTMPGTMVDVLVTGDAQNAGGNNAITRNILEDVRVLAAGQQVQQDKDGKPQTVSVVTLLVDPEQANKLTMAATEGKIQLALRNTIDSKEAKPAAVFRASLFGGAPPAVPGRKRAVAAPPPPPPPFVVEVIKGNKKETSSFPGQ